MTDSCCGEKENTLRFSVIGLKHGHIYGMCRGLIEAGAELVSVYDDEKNLLEAFQKTYPAVKTVSSEQEILEDDSIDLVAGCVIPYQRGDLGIRVMKSGKDYFCDKAPFTTLDQLERARKTVKETGKKYFIYYGERVHSECSVFAGNLVKEGAIGKVIQVIGLGPHRLDAKARPSWFFERQKYGGILCDIGSHQIEQFLYYAGVEKAQVVRSQIGNFAHPEYPELDDFGDVMLLADNGATGYFRVDWFTPDGLSSWGDGRTVILGTDGYIEMRKNLDVAKTTQGDHLFLVNKEGEKHYQVGGKIGFPYFRDLIADCFNRTETAMTQEHAFLAAELSLIAQNQAVKIAGGNF